MIDNDLRTRHIRCGSDIRDRLNTAGFTGDSWNNLADVRRACSRHADLTDILAPLYG
jgi:hypothetical protein